jgi:hypothetical protein
MDKCEKLQLPPASSSEKPNNCEHITEDGVTCAKYPACDYCLDNPLNKVKGSERLLKGKTEPTISKMEQVDEPQTGEHCNTCRHKDECEGATYEYKNTEWWCLAYAPIDEPQTDGYMTAEQIEDYRKMLDKAERKVYGNIEDKPQTDCDHKCIQTEIGCEKDKCPFDDDIPCEWVNCPNSKTDCPWK